MKAARGLSARSARLGAVPAVAARTMRAPAAGAGHDFAPQPAHIHTGTCAELGDVVVPLTDVVVVGQDAEHGGSESAIPVKSSYTEVDMPLQEIIDGGHAINVHLSAEEIGTYIACGDIGGTLMTDEGETGQELVIGLGELNDSGHTGVAWLAETEDGSGTRVGIYLVEPASMTGGTEATGAATPAASADAGVSELAVTIKDFKFQPATIEVPVGGSVTWTNEDSSPHTATGIDREVLQSGTLKTGDAYTQQFDTAGTFEYFCEFHAGMKGTIVVQ